jgi:parallel beta-helix repeat protein
MLSAPIIVADANVQDRIDAIISNYYNGTLDNKNSDESVGIELIRSENNTLEDNIVISNGIGINLERSDNNSFDSNIVVDNSRFNIPAFESHNNTFTNYKRDLLLWLNLTLSRS